MTAHPTPRPCSITHVLNRVLGKGARSAEYGWDVLRSGNEAGTVQITIKYLSEDQDNEAVRRIFEALEDRYSLDYTRILGDYSYLPDEYYMCALITVTCKPDTTTEEPMTDTTPSTPAAHDVRVTLPGRFCDWFEDTGVILGHDDGDPACLELRLSYESAVMRRRGRSYTLTITTDRPSLLATLAEYVNTCIETNTYGRTDRAELRAARTVADRVEDAREELRTILAARAIARVDAARYERTSGGDGTAEWESTTVYAPHVRSEIESAVRQDRTVTVMPELIKITGGGRGTVQFFPLPAEDAPVTARVEWS